MNPNTSTWMSKLHRRTYTREFLGLVGAVVEHVYPDHHGAAGRGGQVDLPQLASELHADLIGDVGTDGPRLLRVAPQLATGYHLVTWDTRNSDRFDDS